MNRRALAALALAVLGLSACGSGETGPAGIGTVPGRPTTTTAPPESVTTTPPTEPAGGGIGGTGGTGGTGGGGTGGSAEVTLYFIRGEKLQPVKRVVPRVTRIGAEAVSALVAGPNEAEKRAGLATAIPAATRFNALTIDDGVARVDLSRSFEAGGSGLGLILRLAQVTCTLDAFPSVSGVRFALDGQIVEVLSGDGIVLDRPVTCAGYEAYLAQPDQGPPPATAAVFPGIWPITTEAELPGSSDPLFRNPVATARAFADRYLGMTDPATFEFRSTGAAEGEVPVGPSRGEGGNPLPNPRPTTTVHMRQLGGVGADQPWTVLGATSVDIEVDAPAERDKISSPVTLTGRARAFEGTVQVEVREDGQTAGQSLGRSFVTGSGDATLGGFRGSATFRAPTRPAGAVVFYERNMADGGTPVIKATVVRVGFA
jgi:hypothetical protein